MRRSGLAISDFLPHYGPPLDEAALAKEKDKARKLRDTPWWKKKKEQGICYYCRKRFKPAELTMDHVIPLARGGRSVKENLVACCKDCNNKKKYLIPAEWADYLKSLSPDSAETNQAQNSPGEPV